MIRQWFWMLLLPSLAIGSAIIALVLAFLIANQKWAVRSAIFSLVTSLIIIIKTKMEKNDL